MSNRSIQNSNVYKALEFDANNEPSGLDDSVTGGLITGSPVTTVGATGTDSNFPTEQATREAITVEETRATGVEAGLETRTTQLETDLGTTQTSIGASSDTADTDGSLFARVFANDVELLALTSDKQDTISNVATTPQTIKDQIADSIAADVDITGLALRDLSNLTSVAVITDLIPDPVDITGLADRALSNLTSTDVITDLFPDPVDISGLAANDLSNLTSTDVITNLIPAPVDISGLATDDLDNLTEQGVAVIDARIAAVPGTSTDITGKVGIDQIYTDTADGLGGSLTDEIPTKGYVDTHITKATAGGTMQRDSLLLDSAPVTINLIDASQIIGGRLVFPYDSAEPNASVGDKIILDGDTTTEYTITTKQLFGAHSWEFFTSGGFGADRVEAITVQAVEVPDGTSFESVRFLGDAVSASISNDDLTVDLTGVDRDIERARIKFEKEGATFEAFGADIMHTHSGNTVADREMILLSFAENDQAQEFADLIDADPDYAIGISGGDFAAVIDTQVNIIPGSNNTLTVYFGEPFTINNGDALGKVNVTQVDIARIRVNSGSLEFEEADGTINMFTPTGGDGGSYTPPDPVRYLEILTGAPAPTDFTGTLPAGFTSGLNYVYLTTTYNRFFSATGESLREGTTVIFSKEYV